MAAEMQKDTEHTYFLSCFCWYCDHVHRRKELGMILHRLGRCLTGNAGGIMSGTKYDMVRSVTSLKYTRGRIMNLSCEKTVFSPIWHQLVNWNSAALHSSNYYLNWELLPPCTVGNPHWPAYLAACKLLSNFEYPYFCCCVYFICFYFGTLFYERNFVIFEAATCQQDIYHK